jgi:hypothetical protein
MEVNNDNGTVHIASSQMLITRANNIPSPATEYAEYEEASETEEFPEENPSFIEGSANAITLADLTNLCTVPTWADNTLVTSHQDFINTVRLAAQDVFPNKSIGEPEIRVSHAQHGRVPTALHKKASELLPSETTLWYQRMCFCIVVSMKDEINGKEVHLTLGGVRAMNTENLSSSRKIEKFKLFIGWRVKICSNLAIFGDAMIDKLECSSTNEIYERAYNLFRGFDPEANRRKLESLANTTMTTEDFTHIIGKLRLYEAMSPAQRNELALPQVILGDQSINSAARNFISNPSFGVGNGSTINCWQFLNLLNESVKFSSYIDKFLQRNVNATDTAFGIAQALNGEDSKYAWFIQ